MGPRLRGDDAGIDHARFTLTDTVSGIFHRALGLRCRSKSAEKDMRKVFLGAFALLMSSAFASAQPVQSALREFGLLGTWAAECAQGPSPGNTHATYAITPAGAAQVSNAFGDGYDVSVYSISEAKALGSDRLSLRETMVSDKNVVLDVVLVKENGKVRIWSSTHADGTPLVTDGVISAPVNRETRWAARCR
jgi:hypothetical protein